MLKTAISKDGTPIAYEQTGSGRPLVLVHGTGGDRSRWALVAPHLAKHFTVCMLDRRGRGGSGDCAPGQAYSVEQEYEDIAAVAAAVSGVGAPTELGAPTKLGGVDVLGHSFGAACVLGAAKRIPNLRRLVLYEPPMLREQHSPVRDDILRRMDEALASGDREAVVVMLTTEMLRVPVPMVERMRLSPAWACSVAAAHTIVRELRVSDAYSHEVQGVCAPSLFLLGSESPQSFKDTTAALCAILPSTRVVTLPGQQHSAMLTAPDVFMQAVIGYLQS